MIMKLMLLVPISQRSLQLRFLLSRFSLLIHCPMLGKRDSHIFPPSPECTSSTTIFLLSRRKMVEASCKVGLLTSSPRPPFPGLFCILQSKVFDLQTSLWLSVNHGAFVKHFVRFSMNLTSWELRFVEWYKKVTLIFFENGTTNANK